MQTTVETLKKCIDDFNTTKSGMTYVGIKVNDAPTSEYGALIKELKPELDKVPVLEQQVNNLTEQNNNLNIQVTDDTNNFDNIYDAIVEKGQTPDKDDRTTYAPAILAISGGGGDIEINDISYLFYNGARLDMLDAILAITKNITNLNYAFYKAGLAGGTTVNIDASNVSNADNTHLFDRLYNNNKSNDITLKVITKGYMRYLFNNLSYDNNGGAINCVVDDNSNKQDIDISNMFNYAMGVKSISINLNGGKITNMSSAFSYFNYKFGDLKVLDLSSINIDWVNSNCYQCFQKAQYLTDIILSSSPVVFDKKDIGNLFDSCSNLINIGSEINTIDIVDTNNNSTSSAYYKLFSDCVKLQKIYFSTKWIVYRNIEYMFNNCKLLASIPYIEMHVVGSNRDSIGYAFYYCSTVTEINIDIIYEDASHKLYCSNAFRYCSSLVNIKGNLDLSLVNSSDLSNLFSNCTSLVSIETNGSFGGNNTDSSMTLDLSASSVFDIASYLNSLASNSSGKTRIIKLNSTVYKSLTDNIKAVATSKNYTLASA